LCAERPAAPSAPTRAWALASSGSSRWCSTSTRCARKKARKPAPVSETTRRASPIASIASGRTSNSATATTTPPLRAISVWISLPTRSASIPPRSVETTVRLASGMAIQDVIRSAAVGAGAVDVDFVRELGEAVALLQLGRLRRCAQLGLFDAAADQADQVVVMAGVAAHVGGPAFTGE